MELLSVKIKVHRSNVYEIEGVDGEFYDVNLFPRSMWGKKYYAIITLNSPLDVIYRLLICEQVD